MNPVIQEEMTGCGIASVAAIAGVSYTLAQTAGASLGIFASARKQRGRESIIDVTETIPVEEGICHVVHVWLREGLSTMC